MEVVALIDKVRKYDGKRPSKIKENQALDDYAAWQVEWWDAQARLSRLQGTPPDASLLCTDPFRESE